MSCTIQNYGFTKNGQWVDSNCRASTTDTIACQATIYFDRAEGLISLWFEVKLPDNTVGWWKYNYEIMSSGTRTIDVGIGTLTAGNYYINSVVITDFANTGQMCSASGTPNNCRSLSVIACPPPGGVQRYCGSDNKTIYVWNQVACKYDSAICSTGHCANGYCDAPPMYNACVGGYCNQQVCPDSGCPANQCTTIGSACAGTLNQISIPSTKSIVKNNSGIITATCKDTTGAGMTCPTLVWSKSNNNVDIVPWSNNIDLTIIGVSVGTCVITAIGGGKFSNNCTVTVTESAGTLSQIAITPSISIVKGNTGSVNSSCKDTLGNNMTCPMLTWNSSNTSVATVVGGMITGVGVGTCIVKATGGGKTSNDCTVTVTESATKYNCVSGTCQGPYTSGTYNSLAECQTACTISATKYNCVSGQCQGPFTTGTYSSLSACQAACVVTPTKYNCVNRQCVGPYTTGTYDSLAACQTLCISGGGADCPSCDPTKNFCILGQCIEKNTAYIAGALIFGLMVLRK